jgi:hypothetical protein
MRREKEYEEKLKVEAEGRQQTQAAIRSEIESDPVEQRMRELGELRQQQGQRDRDSPEQIPDIGRE